MSAAQVNTSALSEHDLAQPKIRTVIKQIERETSSREEAELTCLHEAGHVTMAELLGIETTHFFGPAVSRDPEGKLHATLASVVHGSVGDQRLSNLLRDGLINVAGGAAVFVLTGQEPTGCGGDWENFSNAYRKTGDYSDFQLNVRWNEMFRLCCQMFSFPEMQELLKLNTNRFRNFMTQQIHIDVSGIEEKDRNKPEVVRAVTNLQNLAVGAKASLDQQLDYCAAEAVWFDQLGVPYELMLPAVTYRNEKKILYQLTERFLEIWPRDGWVAKYMKRPDADVLKVAVAYVIGHVIAPAQKLQPWYSDHEYKLKSKVGRVYAKYDAEYRQTVKMFDDEQKSAMERYQALSSEQKETEGWPSSLWKQRQELQDSVFMAVKKTAREMFEKLPPEKFKERRAEFADRIRDYGNRERAAGVVR